VPELPDIELYLHALRPRVVGQVLAAVRIAGPFFLRTVDPLIQDSHGRVVVEATRVGKRIALWLEGDRCLVLHLMIAGRLRWTPPRARIPARLGLASLDFDRGSLLITEAGARRRASLHYLAGREALAAIDPGGLEVFGSSFDEFASALTRENHTLKRALTDPHLLSGIGHAYSDEILHAARLSPMRLTSRLDHAEIARLHAATTEVLATWRDKLIAEARDDFPTKVTAFRKGMAAHGRYGQPCARCGTPIQRIRYATNEANYCPTCQTEGRLLADRSLSRLLKEDWPKSLEELEQYKQARRRS
jgi:formamidopyrimidine-DNA glycosylase